MGASLISLFLRVGGQETLRADFREPFSPPIGLQTYLLNALTKCLVTGPISASPHLCFLNSSWFTEPARTQIHPILNLSQQEMIQQDRKGGYRFSLVLYLITALSALRHHLPNDC